MSEGTGSGAGVQSMPPRPSAVQQCRPGSALHGHARVILERTIADDSRPEQVAIASLKVGDSPRLRGEDPSHTLLLAEAGDVLPPIIVHRDTRHVVDGVHRVYAALMNGRDSLQAYYFDGSPEEAFVLAVALNVGHGLALALPDRRAAATRIMQSYPQWSDRAVAQSTGLSATTIAAIRRSTVGVGQLNVRLGRDGRVRPLNAASGRRTAAEYLIAHPESSLRTVARVAGISPATVRDVRNRLLRGQSPVPSHARGEHECDETEKFASNTGPHADDHVRLRGLAGPSAPCPADTLAACAHCLQNLNCPAGLRDKSPRTATSLS